MSDDHIKAHDEAVRKDEREKIGKALIALHKRSQKLADVAKDLALDILKFNDAAGVLSQPNGSTPPTKAKRKPVAVTAEQVQTIGGLLKRHEAMAYSVKDVAEHNGAGIGLKTCAAALRQLVAEGKASETTRGRFRAVAQPAVADGAEQ